jgi:LuxR family quorum-sensing system transcriptional regulator CciR
MHMNVFDFVEKSNASRSPEELFDLLVTSSAQLGFDRVAYGALNYRERLRAVDCAPQAVILNYPEHWQKTYAARMDHHIDPVVLFGSQFRRPFHWRSLLDRELLNKRQRLFLEEANEAGLRDGISMSLPGTGSKIALLSFAASAEGADSPQTLRRLAVLAHQFHLAFGELSSEAKSNDELIMLSSRERDCLHWTALGKSSWDIGEILSISENTVNFHIKNSMRKLSTSSRTVAVIAAIQRGLIDIPA